MKSIRFSLVVYFLVLLGGALGAVSALLYRTARATLLEKNEVRRDLLEQRYRDQCKEVQDKLDTELVYHANALANLVQFKLDWDRGRPRPWLVYGSVF